MSKLLKETPVHMACPACGKMQRVKLKWAKNHKSCKCKNCKKSIDLKDHHPRNMITRTGRAVEALDKTLKALHVEAKKVGKSFKAKKSKAKKTGKKAKKAKHAKKAKQVRKSMKAKPAPRKTAPKPAPIPSRPTLPTGSP